MSTEERLATLLRERAAEVADTGPATTEVARRARRVRRRRSVTPLLAAATVCAVVLAGGVVLRHDSPQLRPTFVLPTPDRSGPSRPRVILPIGIPDPLGEIDYGDFPHVEAFVNGSIERTDGTRFRVEPPVGVPVTGFVRTSEGLLLTTEHGWVLAGDDSDRIRAAMGETSTDPGSAQVVFDPAFDQAWSVSGGRLDRVPRRVTEDQRDYPAAGMTPAGLLSRGRIVLTGKDRVEVLDLASGESTTVPGLGDAATSTADGDLIAGSAERFGPTVVVTPDGRRLWETDDGWRPISFSPDGRFLAAVNNATGGDDGAIGILDAATGKVVAEQVLLGNGLSTGGGARRGVAWEDDALLVPLTDGDRWALVRIGTDGEISLATEPRTGEKSPWVLPVG